jgi:hypothetical protein
MAAVKATFVILSSQIRTLPATASPVAFETSGTLLHGGRRSGMQGAEMQLEELHAGLSPRDLNYDCEVAGCLVAWLQLSVGAS